jgi:HrpA-like RNA helicase
MTFEDLPENALPEIHRSSLTSVVLQLKILGVVNPMSFGFLSRPSKESFSQAIFELIALQCLDSQGNVTALGKRLAEFPLDPKFGKIVLTAMEQGCLEEILTIISMMSLDSPIFVASKDSTLGSGIKRFKVENSDHLSLLAIYNAVEESQWDLDWCKENGINLRSLRKASEIRKQLWNQCRLSKSSVSHEMNDSLTERILRALFSGLFLQVATLALDGTYRTLEHNQSAQIHPSSCVSGRKKPPHVMYTDLVRPELSFALTC